MAGWTCRACGGDNPDATRFCGHCGSPLQAVETSAAASPDVTTTLRSLVSRQVADRLEESEGLLNEERRLVTAVFADISGFTPLADRFDPEQLAEIIDPVIAALSGVIAKYEGYVEKFAGDAILALFGAPVSHEDDAQRALSAALELHAELARIRELVPYEHDLGLHVGVNSGHGIARIFGTDARMDYSVLGDSIILAQRLESAAPNGQTYVGDITYRLAKNRFEFEWVGELTLKGKAKPVPAWRLLGERKEPPAQAASATPDRPRLIGRERELATAGSCLDDLLEGRGGLVTVIGEPGVGKTRLKQELADEADRRGERWMEAACVSYGAGLTYAPFAQLLRTFAQIAIDQSPELAGEALAAALARVGAQEAGPYFARLLGLPPPEGSAEVIALEPEAFRRGLHEAFSSWLARVAGIDPLVVVIEDCHWMDASSRALACDLVQGPAAGLFLLYLTSRPEGAAVLAQIAVAAPPQRVERIELASLDRPAVERVLSGLLAGTPPRHFAELVAERTGGNPFFIGELVRALRDEGALVGSGHGWQLTPGWEAGTLPPSLEGVLSARIDLLPVAARMSLLAAAVIGRRVPRELLEDVSPHAAEGVPVLIDRGFFDVVRDGTGALQFHHALIQEAAYSRLLRRQRLALHRRVAELAEELYGAGDDVIDLLARHAYLGAIGAKAITFLRRAGERSARLFANAEAILSLRRALELARAESDGEQQVADLLLTLADLQDLIGSYDEAYALYDEASRLSGDVRAFRGLASVLRRQGRYREAAQVVEDAFAVVPSEQTAPLWLEQAWTLAVEGRAEETLEAAHAGLEVAAPEEPLRPYLLLQVAHAERLRGFHRSALDHALEARRLLQAQQDERGLTTALRVTAGIHLNVADYDSAAAALREGLGLAERMGNAEELAGCLINLGMVEFQRHQLDEAILCDRRAIEEFERIGHGAGRAIGYGNLAEKLAARGDLEEALRTAELAQDIARSIGHAGTIADVLQTMAAIHLQRGQYETAAQRADEAVEVHLAAGAAREAADAAQTAATAWTSAGCPDKAAASRSRVTT